MTEAIDGRMDCIELVPREDFILSISHGSLLPIAVSAHKCYGRDVESSLQFTLAEREAEIRTCLRMNQLGTRYENGMWGRRLSQKVACPWEEGISCVEECE